MRDITPPQIPQYELRRFGNPITNNTGDNSVLINNAMEAINSAGGGELLLPPGELRCTEELLLSRNRVAVRGHGRRATHIRFPSALGNDQYAFGSGVVSGGSLLAPSFRDFGIVGPGGGSLTGSSGAKTANAPSDRSLGVLVPDGAVIDNVYINGFYGGLVTCGNHQYCFRIMATGNWINCYFAPGITTAGDQQFWQCDFTGATWASIGIAGSNLAASVSWIGCHLGSAPYAIWKGDDPDGTASNQPGILYSHFIDTSFESCGNAAYLDESTGTPNSIGETLISNPGFSWSNTPRLAAKDRDYAMHVRSCNRVTVRSLGQPFAKGDVGTYNLGTSWDIHDTTPYQNMFGASCVGSQYTFHNEDRTGTIYTVRTGATSVAAGELLEFSAGDVQRYGTSTRVYAGVAAHAAAADEAVVVWRSGRVPVLCKSLSAACYLTPDATTPYHAAQAGVAGAVPWNAPIIGMYRSSGGSSEGTLLTVELFDSINQPGYVVPKAVTALPTAGATYRGQMLRVEGGAGVADVLSVCMKKDDNTYAWLTVGVS